MFAYFMNVSGSKENHRLQLLLLSLILLEWNILTNVPYLLLKSRLGINILLRLGRKCDSQSMPGSN